MDDTGLDTADNLSNTGIINVNLANIEPEDGAGWQYKIGEDDWQTGEGSSFVLPNPDGETTYDASTILVRQVDAVGNASEAYSLEQASRLADAATAAVDLAVEAEGVAETKADEASAATAEVARIQSIKEAYELLTDEADQTVFFESGAGVEFDDEDSMNTALDSAVTSATQAVNASQSAAVNATSLRAEADQLVTESNSIFIDSVAPDSPVASLVSDEVQISTEAELFAGVFEVAGEVDSEITISLDGQNGSTSKTVTGAGSENPSLISLDNDDIAALGEGSVTVSITQTDLAGNEQTSVATELQFVIDTVNPDSPVISVGDGNATLTEAGTGVFSVTGEDQADITVTLRGSEYTTAAAELSSAASQEEADSVFAESAREDADAAELAAQASEAVAAQTDADALEVTAASLAETAETAVQTAAAAVTEEARIQGIQDAFDGLDTEAEDYAAQVTAFFAEAVEAIVTIILSYHRQVQVRNLRMRMHWQRLYQQLKECYNYCCRHRQMLKMMLTMQRQQQSKREVKIL